VDVIDRPGFEAAARPSQLGALARGMVAGGLVGLVGDWRGPVVSVLALVSGLTFFDLGRRDRAEQEGRADRQRDWYGDLMQLAFFAVLCAAAWDNRSRTGVPVVGRVEALGLVLVAAGAWLRQLAARALGRHFTVKLSLLDDHRLVSTGPYRWLRHPNYAGLGLIALGTALMLRSPAAAATALVLWLPAMLLRMRDEERKLHRRLGAAYSEYARRSWRLLPGIY
jgi:protein-S-isoprenylcysteine O-methyltransferase Ste14